MYTKFVIDTKDMLLNKPSFELSKNYKKSKLSKKKKKKMEKGVQKQKAKRHTYKSKRYSNK